MPNYRLQDPSPQFDFYKSRAKIQFMGGGFGNGKTTAAVIKGIRLATDYPGSNGLFARATYPKLNDTLRKEFFKWCPANLIRRMPTKDDNTAYLHNGTTVNFRYLMQRGKQNEDGSTTSNLLSANYDWAIVDQVEDPEIQYKDFLDLMGRLRGQTGYVPNGEEDPSMPATGPRWLILTANPTMGWVFRELIEPYLRWLKNGVRDEKLIVDANTGIPVMQLIEGSTYTNAANLPQDFISGLEATYKGQQFQRFVMGKWAAYEGLVYDSYDPTIHQLSQEEIVSHLADCVARHVQVKVIEGYDFGLQSPSCYGLWFIDDWSRMFLLDGFYKPNFAYDEQPDAILEIRDRWSDYLKYSDPIRADPDIFKRKVVAGKRDTGSTVAKLLSVHGLTFRPASNDITSGIAKVKGFINFHKKIEHPITGVTPAPMLYVNDKLEWFDREIMNYFWQRNPQGQTTDTPRDFNDHGMDMTKYSLIHLPDPSDVVIPKDVLPPGWMRWREVEEHDAV